MPPNTQADALRGTIDILALTALLARPLRGSPSTRRMRITPRGPLTASGSRS